LYLEDEIKYSYFELLGEAKIQIRYSYIKVKIDI